MASRFSVDISPLKESINILGEQRRMEAERDAQQKQALLTFLASAGGFAAGGPAGAQFGASAAQLLGPRPNPAAAVSLGLGGFNTNRQEAAMAERQSALEQFSNAVNPQTIPMADPSQFDTSAGPTVTTGPNRQAAAGAAARLGDLGTAAGLVFPKEGSQTPDLFNVTVPDPKAEGGVRVLASGVPLGQALETRSGNQGSVVTKIGTTPVKADTGGTGKEPPLFDVWDKSGKNLIANAVPLSDAQTAAQGAPGARIRKFDASGTDSGEGSGKNLPAHMRVDLNDLRKSAIGNVINLTGRTDIIDAARNGATIAQLSKIGNIPEAELLTEYKTVLQNKVKENIPDAEKAVARAELEQVNQRIEQRQRDIRQAREAAKQVKTEAQRQSFLQELEQANLSLTDLNLGPKMLEVAK